jgi:hypothetical protein
MVGEAKVLHPMISLSTKSKGGSIDVEARDEMSEGRATRENMA